MKNTILVISLFFSIQTHAQLNDNMWLFNQLDSNSFQMDFRQTPPLVTIGKKMKMVFSNASFSDDDGNLLFYSNGIILNNQLNQLMENGDSLNVGYWADVIGTIPVRNSAFFLPKPNDSTQVFLLYVFPEISGSLTKVYYALLDKASNNGLGKVVEKNILILSGSVQMNFNHAGAVRHANGRDWWIIVPNRMEPFYYRILLSPDGFSSVEEQEIGFKIPTSNPNFYLGDNLFSPNGDKYVDYDFRTGAQFFDFDRCTGLLSNPIKIDYDYLQHSNSNNGQSGVAFSPSGRFAYLTYSKDTGLELVQYDLEATDVISSETLISSCPASTNSQYICSMGRLLLGIDQKIYVTAQIDTNAFHIIHQPDKVGQACDFEFGGFKFPMNHPRLEFPYFPNYRLYDLPGSPCDTLGIDAPPVAVTGEERETSSVAVYPNPASHEVNLRQDLPGSQPATLSLFSLTGQPVRHWQVAPGLHEQRFPISGLPEGIYFWQLRTGVSVLGSGRLVLAK